MILRNAQNKIQDPAKLKRLISDLIGKELDDFVARYNSANRHERTATERFNAYSYGELVPRDKASLDIFWLRDEFLKDTANDRRASSFATPPIAHG